MPLQMVEPRLVALEVPLEPKVVRLEPARCKQWALAEGVHPKQAKVMPRLVA